MEGEEYSLLSNEVKSLDDQSENPWEAPTSDEVTFRSAHTVPVLLTWRNVHVTLTPPTSLFACFSSAPPEEPKTVLDSVCGYARPGTLTAILGSSGAGKSTLLDVLSERKNLGAIQGEILMNGMPRSSSFKRFSAYVTQEDVLMPSLTVYETLMFNVCLKMERDESISQEELYEERHKRVMQMIHELALERVTHDRVGDDERRGISGGEKKRVSIGCEMISDPSLLFLDEPTTGLDAYNSQQVVYTLKKMALAGRTIVCTLHQPRSSIFALFDNLICLSEGRVVYFGAAKDAVSYFEQETGRQCSRYYNPADFIIDFALEDERRRFAAKIGRAYSKGKLHSDSDSPASSLADVYAKSQMNSLQLKALDDLVRNRNKRESLFSDVPIDDVTPEHYIPKISRFAVSWPYQLAYLLKRQYLNLVRTPSLSIAVIVQALFMSLFIGSLFRTAVKPGSESEVYMTAQNRLGALFFAMSNLAWGQMSALLQFNTQKGLFLKEKAAGLYRISSFFMAKMFADFPSLIIGPLVFSITSYWVIGFQAEVIRFLVYIGIIMIFVFTMTSFYVFIGCAAPNPQVAQIVAPLVTVSFLVFGGFFVSADLVPKYYIWLKYISPFRYAYNALLQNQFSDFCLCTDTTSEGTCPTLCDGNNWLSCDLPNDGCLLGKNSPTVWQDIVILAGMVVVYRVLGYVALRTLYNQKK